MNRGRQGKEGLQSATTKDGPLANSQSTNNPNSPINKPLQALANRNQMNQQMAQIGQYLKPERQQHQQQCLLEEQKQQKIQQQQQQQEEEQKHQIEIQTQTHQQKEQQNLQEEQSGEQQQQVEVKPDPDPIPIESDDVVMDSGNEALVNENSKPLFKKIFAKRKKSSVRAREKKIRQNRQLRKAIMPKNALMALHEVKGVTIGDFMVSPNDENGFTTIVTVNNKQYEGRGKSKISAKNNACEKALRDFVILRMSKKPRLSRQTIEAMETADASNEERPQEAAKSEEDDADDELPMINLASFALFKLFSEWESEGFIIPELHPAVQSANEIGNGAAAVEEKKTLMRNELPTNWESMHPATLLCMMRPGTSFAEIGITGEKPNILQVLSVVVDGQTFIANGRSKRIARRNAAVDACNTRFGTNFSMDEVLA